ncbi:hypothetical protein BLD44_026525 [Mastigocladus laminosus UU774]|nr:hypothetical protein B4U84_24720 [Westiellopsis prolifica IICB1]TFI51316.1 hypothetical protein BLD44_026525 [Mastigocladus laminosus UU774]
MPGQPFWRDPLASPVKKQITESILYPIDTHQAKARVILKFISTVNRAKPGRVVVSTDEQLEVELRKRLAL